MHVEKCAIHVFFRAVPQISMGRHVQLCVSIMVIVEDPMVQVEHLLHVEALLLTFPEGMPLPGVQREAGATVKSTVQCIPKVRHEPSALFDVSISNTLWSQLASAMIVQPLCIQRCGFFYPTQNNPCGLVGRAWKITLFDNVGLRCLGRSAAVQLMKRW